MLVMPDFFINDIMWVLIKLQIKSSSKSKGIKWKCMEYHHFNIPVIPGLWYIQNTNSAKYWTL